MKNKRIAEFMGVVFHDDVHTVYKVGYYDSEGYYIGLDLKYHTSWDWLMPVAQKIEDYLSDNIGKVGYFDDGLISNDIEVRYQSVVEFIKFYNTKKEG